LTDVITDKTSVQAKQNRPRNFGVKVVNVKRCAYLLSVYT